MIHDRQDSGRNDDVIRRPRAGDRRSGWRRLALGAAAISLFVAACEDDDDTTQRIEDEIDEINGAVADAIDEFGQDSVELVARNLASRQGAEEFSDAGHPIDGDLQCTAVATDDLTAVEIECGGATEDGSVAALTGTTTELPGASVTELEGTFVGLVDSAEVFSTEDLG
jgi:hypothetical protein